MARDRQRAKQRQEERRARRLAEQGGNGQQDQPPEGQAEGEPRVEDPRAAEPAPGIDPHLSVGAPPEDEGRSDAVLQDEPDDLDEDVDPELVHDAEEAGALASVDGEDVSADEAYAPRGRRGDDAAAVKNRPRFVQFLFACWAELQRVQWPNRQALTTLTGVVLGFVLIAGSYLGLLDAIFSRLVNAIL